MNLDYTLIDHTADIGIETSASSLEELFEKCALILSDLITDLDRIKPAETKKIVLEDENIEQLLIRFLNELLYILSVENFITCKVKVLELNDNRLKAQLEGEKLDLSKHPIKEEIKAATYHDFKLEKQDSTYVVRIIFDI